MNRRQFLKTVPAAMAMPAVAAHAPPEGTRGIVLYPFDLSLSDWPDRAHQAGLTTIGLHAARRFDVLRDFMLGDAGKKFLARCAELGLAVEYELHAMGELLSRELINKDPKLFRLDAAGNRNPDANCCPHSQTALEIIADKAVVWAKIFQPTTHRYFYWPDDGAQWCACPQCREFSASEQALIVENQILAALRSHDVLATLAHISYSHTLVAPRRVKPVEGVFLEFAPIARNYAHSLADPAAKTNAAQGPDPQTNRGYLEILAANLAVFGVERAQVLEYWLDVSLFSKWTRPAVQLPWNSVLCKEDVEAYRKLGIRNITTFATYIDADYVKLHGDPQSVLNEYGGALKTK